MMRVGIAGVTGYTGSELVRLLHLHDGVEITYITSHSYAGQPLSRIRPHFWGRVDMECRSFSVEEAVEKTDLVFSALPHGDSMEVVPKLLAAGLKVVDLSADFRLKSKEDYKKWYGREHCAQDYLLQAVYGLPELYREEIAGASLVANPGCYPTSVLLALAPLAREGLLSWKTLVVDAKSGTSGAGRSPSQVLHYPECAESFRPYRVAVHQHTGEMEQELSRLIGNRVSFTFVPHLVPMVRGILSTIYTGLEQNLKVEELYRIYTDFYAGEKFVQVLSPSYLPETGNVYGSNFCHISLTWDERNGRLIIISALDNLVKGASGQAVQNMNLMFGYDEDRGLKMLPLRP